MTPTAETLKWRLPVPNPKWYEIAEKEIGIHEVPGVVNNPRILEYHAATSYGAKDDETPWCSAFINWVFKQAGIQGTNNAAARSWLNWGVPLSTPILGCVVVYWRNRPDGWQGHVNLYQDEDPSHIVGLGGNQGQTVNLSRYPKNHVLGFRWPKSIEIPIPPTLSPSFSTTTQGATAEPLTSIPADSVLVKCDALKTLQRDLSNIALNIDLHAKAVGRLLP